MNPDDESKVSLRDLFEQRIEALEKQMETTSHQMERRLDSMNDIKSQLVHLLTKSEYEVFVDKVNEDIRMLRESKATLEGKASQASANLAMLIAVIGVVIGIVSMIHSFMK